MIDNSILGRAIENLITAVTENTELRKENHLLKKKLFEEVAKYEQEKSKE